MKHTTFTVTGRGQFPIDMLRYDACWPSTGENASKLADSFANPNVTRKITLETTQKYSPTVGRWNSFLWGVNL